MRRCARAIKLLKVTTAESASDRIRASTPQIHPYAWKGKETEGFHADNKQNPEALLRGARPARLEDHTERLSFPKPPALRQQCVNQAQTGVSVVHLCFVLSGSPWTTTQACTEPAGTTDPWLPRGRSTKIEELTAHIPVTCSS